MMAMGKEEKRKNDYVVGGDEGDDGGLSELMAMENHNRNLARLYESHRISLETIFPELVWRNILDAGEKSLGVLEPEDQENCSNASPYFSELLQDKKVLFLFPKVFEIMASREETQTKIVTEEDARLVDVELDEEEDDNEEEEDDGNKDNHSVWTKTVLKCRLVCSAWNNGIEKFYEKHNEFTNLLQDFHKPDPRSTLNMVLVAWTQDNISRENFDLFLNKFGESHHSGYLKGEAVPPKNPFFGRCVEFLLDNVENDFNAISKILSMFGEHIWYCTFVNDAQAQFYLKTQEWLECMPNLKFLQIRDNGPAAGNLHWEGFQLPKLKDLEYLGLETVNRTFAMEMIRRNEHIEFLELSGRGRDELEPEQNTFPLSNLKWLSTRWSELGDRLIERFGPNSKLAKLSLKCSDDSAGIFKLLETNWADSLEDVDLTNLFTIDPETRMVESRELRLNLKGVRKLRVSVSGPISLDFALPLANTLEHLSIGLCRCLGEDSFKVEGEDTFQFIGFEGKMAESNIWKLFPNLKTINLNGFEIEGVPRWCALMYTNDGKRFVHSERLLKNRVNMMVNGF